ncbi:MAG: tryptophan 7-halogenase, partial [Myxococcota bacterium]
THRRTRGAKLRRPPASDDVTSPCGLHHVFDGGWLYALRFRDGITSAGLCVQGGGWLQRQIEQQRDPKLAWDQALSNFPSIQAQFESATLETELFRTARLQRQVHRATGDRWALLPHAAGFVDPLHSTGIAHTLLSVERLVEALRERGPRRATLLQGYDDALRRERALVDVLVHGSYASFHSFPVFSSFAMLYFAAAHFSEQQRRAGLPTGFLNADDSRFVSVVHSHHQALLAAGVQARSHEFGLRFSESVAQSIAPWNLAGLADPKKRNMYACL